MMVVRLTAFNCLNLINLLEYVQAVNLKHEIF